MVMVASENERLRRCMNSILSITALPAVWTGGSVNEICTALLDGLRTILDVDFLVLKVGRHEEQDAVLTKPNGMGIGLSVSRSIIEAHKGKMWAESIPSGGAIFGFALPFDKDSVDRPSPPGMKTS